MKKSVIFLEILKRKSKITSVMIIKQHIKKEHTELKFLDQMFAIFVVKISEQKMAKHHEYSHPIPGMMFKSKLCPKESIFQL